MRIYKRALCLLAISTSATALAGAPNWAISESSGRVFVGSAGISRAATRGGALTAGDIVSTGANSRAVLVRGGEYLVIAPNSNIQIAKPTTAGGITAIIENFGNAIYTIKQKATPHFGVQTPYLAAVVKGTTFSVTVTEKGASVQVIEGRVEVSTRDGGASYMVLPGDIGSVSASAPLSLAVQGRETRTIESTNRGANVAPTPAPAPVEPAPAPSETAPSLDGTVTAAVSEGPVSLATMSNGMVQGDSSLTAVVAAVQTAAAEPVRALPTATPVPEVPVQTETVPAPLPPTPADLPPPPPPSLPTDLPPPPPPALPTDDAPVIIMTPPTPVPVDVVPGAADVIPAPATTNPVGMPPLPIDAPTGPGPKTPVQAILTPPKGEPVTTPPFKTPDIIIIPDSNGGGNNQGNNNQNGSGNHGSGQVEPVVEPIITNAVP